MLFTDSEIHEAVKEDIQKHLLNGVDLNPYSTTGSRDSWNNGFNSKPQSITDYVTAYRRGQMCAALFNQFPE